MNNLIPDRQIKVPLTLCMVLFIVTFFVNKDFDLRYIYNYAVVMGFLACAFLADGMARLDRAKAIYVFLAAVFVFYAFLPNSVRNSTSTNQAISIILFTLCCIMTQPTKKEMRLSVKILFGWAIAIALYVMLVKVYPGIYWDYIYPHMSAGTQERAVYMMRTNSYGVPVGGSATYADYILMIGLFICIGKLLGGKIGKVKGYLYLIAAFVFLLAMVIENRRSELLAAIISVMLLFVLNTKILRISASGMKKVIAALVAMMGGLALLISRGMLDRYIATFAGLSEHSAGSIEKVGNGRIALWREALDHFTDSPIFGIGWEQFSAKNQIGGMEGNNVHNDYLQWLCETGIVGFILIVTPMLVLWIFAMKRCRTMRINSDVYTGEARCFAMVSCGIQTFLLIMHMMDPCFYKLVFWAIFSLAIVFYIQSKEQAEERNQ